ncbi:MAG: META domain-containing protein [Treponema sp.]|jgi:hypothetical protein|nr:META domain-containing protein [Treponema sp.]
MKKTIVLLFVVIVLLASCASSGQSQAQTVTPNFSDVAEKEWKLTEVWVNRRNSGFNRNALTTEGFGDAFTLKFADNMISGRGAPNLYSAPFSLGEGRAISVQMGRSTLMAPIFEPASLKEFDYFNYIQNANEWNLAGNNLELTSKNANGQTVVLIFN